MTTLARLVSPLLAGLLLAVAGCGGDDENDRQSLEGTEWTLVEGVEAPPDAVPTATFTGEVATGFAGCNSYGADYQLDGASIAVGEIAASAMDCPGLPGESEEAYFAALAGVDGWSIEDGELVLSSDGDEVLRYATAAGR